MIPLGLVPLLIALPVSAVFVTRQIWKLRNNNNKPPRSSPSSLSDAVGNDAAASDPTLLRKHSSRHTIHVPSTGYTYPAVRVFNYRHPQRAKLPQLPLLVFLHGLGGSVAQWHPLLTSLVNLAPCLAVDLPGCGLSPLVLKEWDAYSAEALVELLAVIINKHRDKDQDVVLICHSMGCSLGAYLASSTSPYASLLSKRVKGLIALCPPSTVPSQAQVKTFRRLLSIPGPIFDIWRAWDRRGGTESPSIARFTGPNAEPQLKRLQVLYNEQSKTPTWRRMAWGVLPTYDSMGRAHGGAFLGEKIWAGVNVPVMLVAGQEDSITKPEEAVAIAGFLGRASEAHQSHAEETPLLSEHTSPPSPLTSPESSDSGLSRTVRLVILPSPASHAIIYAPITVRVVSSHIQHFLAESITEHLSVGWQLQYMTTEKTWDVKNVAKWTAVQPVSTPMAGLFRAMKTLREVDQEHTPKVFVEQWSRRYGNGKDGKGPIDAVLDLSHDSPVYDPAGLEEGGILYCKFPTVSKFPPTVDEVSTFIQLVDQLRRELGDDQLVAASSFPCLIAVHCHYGFNRTAFFLVAYMVERLGWPLQSAIDEFTNKRPPGIKHDHFITELWGRYWDRPDERRC